MRLWSAKRSFDSPPRDSVPGNAGRFQAGGDWAGIAYDPSASRGHVESWFLKANDPNGGRALWLKWTVWAGDRAPDRAVAEAWAVAFRADGAHVATKMAVPFEQASFEQRALGASVGGCTLTARSARGRVESGGRAIEYDLTIEALEGPYGLYPSRWMYAGPIPSQKVVSPIPRALVSGRAYVDGEHWDLEAWPGMVGHNWGRHTESYVWAHCNHWDDGADIVFEGASGRIRAAGVLWPLCTGLVVRQRGTTYALSDLAAIARNEAQITARRWQFHGSARDVEIRGELWADTDAFVGLFYANPDGVTIHCLNTKVAHAELTVRVAGRMPRVLRSTRAALEIGTTDPQHGVRMYL